jgi:hypothetical protein
MDPEWRALIYVASRHGYSAPHLRLEEGLRRALGEALEADPRLTRYYL